MKEVHRPRLRFLPLLVAGFLFSPRAAAPQSKATFQPAGTPKAITSPKQHLGFNIGDDYCLAIISSSSPTGKSWKASRIGSRW